MSSSINFSEILMTSVLGIMLAIIIRFTTAWRTKDKSSETFYIKMMLIMTLVVQIANPCSYLFDGYSGVLYRLLLQLSNNIIYASNVVIGLLWMAIVSEHLNVKISKLNGFLVHSISLVALILLVVTQFVPIVYGIDSNNSYYRGKLYPLYTLIQLLFSVDGIMVYIRARRKGGILKLFPVWQFTVPVIIGAILQQMVYGVTIIVPCVAVSIFGLMLGLQNDRVYSDELTGTYNRFYMDYIKSKLDKKKSGKMTIIMLRLNDIKRINTEYSFSEGDRVITDIAEIMNSLVSSRGSVVRYSGNEFIILLNTEKPDEGSYTVLNIRRALMEYNVSSEGRYNLNISIGSDILDMKSNSIDSIIDAIEMNLKRNIVKYQ